MPDPAINPDEKAVFDALLEAGVRPALAHTAVRSIRDMAAANLIARFESKLDAQNATLESKLDAQNARLDAISSAQSAKLDAQDSKLRMLMWMIGAAVGVIGTLIRVWG